VSSRLRDLVAAWRATAANLCRYGADPQARALESAADDLDDVLRAEQDELLTLTEASVATGYTADHIGRLVRDGKVPNCGRPSAPRVRRADLPPKKLAVARRGPKAYDVDADARSLASRLQYGDAHGA
jgi:hypothetical protein